MKTETFLRLAGIEYAVEVVTDPRKLPKGKGPVIKHEDRIIADSTFIQGYLMQRFELTIDDHLTASRRATAHAFSRMLEERYYWAIVYSRWSDPAGWRIIQEFWFGHLSWPMKPLLRNIYHKKMLGDLYAHGLGRHSRDEIYQLASHDLRAVADYLADKPYFLGQQVSSVDAVVYAMLANTIDIPLDTPLQTLAQKHENLVAYCKQMKARYFSD